MNSHFPQWIDLKVYITDFRSPPKLTDFTLNNRCQSPSNSFLPSKSRRQLLEFEEFWSQLSEYRNQFKKSWNLQWKPRSGFLGPRMNFKIRTTFKLIIWILKAYSWTLSWYWRLDSNGRAFDLIMGFRFNFRNFGISSSSL